MSQKYVPSNLKRLQSSPKLFEKRMYSPRSVTYNSIDFVYFLMNTTEIATRIGDQKTQVVRISMPKRIVRDLFILRLWESDWNDKRHLHGMSIKRDCRLRKSTYIAINLWENRIKKKDVMSEFLNIKIKRHLVRHNCRQRLRGNE